MPRFIVTIMATTTIDRTGGRRMERIAIIEPVDIGVAFESADWPEADTLHLGNAIVTAGLADRAVVDISSRGQS